MRTESKVKIIALFRCPNMGQPWMLVRAAAILLVTRQTLALSDM